MSKKTKKPIIFIICDGMGDLPVKKFGNMTPLQAAKTPNMDRLSRDGVNGSMYVLGKGVRPNSDEAHLTLFGYKKNNFPKRGPIEAAGVGIKLKHGDIAIRANFATVDKQLRVKDRRAGRIQNTEAMTKKLNGMKINGIEFIVKSGTGHRVVIVMRGKNLSDKIGNSDVHYVGETKIVEDWLNHKVCTIKPLNKTASAKLTARTLQIFLEKSHEILDKHPLNIKRAKQGKPKGNYFVTRYPGYYKVLESFKKKYNLKACCIAGAGLYRGLGAIAGMEFIKVKGATGQPNTNVKAKFLAAKKALKKYNFIFVHIKPTDVFSENGDCLGKKKFIEKIDKALKVLLGVNALVVVTADHSTPCRYADHSADPVPLLVHGSNVAADKVIKFGEKECKKGAIGTINGKDLMRLVIKLNYNQ